MFPLPGGQRAPRSSTLAAPAAEMAQFTLRFGPSDADTNEVAMDFDGWRDDTERALTTDLSSTVSPMPTSAEVIGRRPSARWSQLREEI